MNTKELKELCEKYANVYLPCMVYSSALSLYQRKFNCDYETARHAIGLATGGEVVNILFN